MNVEPETLFGLIFILCAFPCGIFTMGIFANKGRSKVAGFILGFLLNIFGVIIALFIPSEYIGPTSESATIIEIVSSERDYRRKEYSMAYRYKMVQIPPQITVKAKEHRGNEAARYLQSLVNEAAEKGWEFYRVDTIGVATQPGCLARLFGARQTLIHYYVVTFRIEVAAPDLLQKVKGAA